MSTNDIKTIRITEDTNANSGYKNTPINIKKNRPTTKITVPVYTDFKKLFILNLYSI